MDSKTNSYYQFKFNRRLYDYWSKKGLRYLKWARVKTSGLDAINNEKGPALIAANHLSWQDILFIAAMIQRPVSFAATFKLFDRKICHEWLNQYFAQFSQNKIIQRTIQELNVVLAKFLVDRVPQCGTFPAKLDPQKRTFLDQAKEALLKDKFVCIFPEGGFGTEEKLRRFKLGLSKILFDFFEETKINVPVYPIGITGTKRLYRPGMKLGFHVGMPIYIEDFIQQNVRKTLLEFSGELRNKVYKLIVSDKEIELVEG
jgi:1-acyl-sn-glycerol-3-phosphate acyltransferase